ncbi:MAG: hypothetical protein WAN11_28530 [Syntrophobacteraceae bacterium]
MENVALWKLSAERLRAKNPTGFWICKVFSVLLGYIHKEDWQGACHASCIVLYSLLSLKNISAEICLGEVSHERIYFDHSWVEIDGEIYDAAISNTLSDLYFPPVFGGIDLATGNRPSLRYGTPSGQGYDQSARWIRSISASEYMSAFPDHPQGLFGLTKLIGRKAGIQVNINGLRKIASNAVWKERP